MVLVFWTLLGVLVSLAPLAEPMVIESKYISITNTEGVIAILMLS